VGKDPGITAGIAMDCEPKVAVSVVEVVRTDRTVPLPGVPDGFRSWERHFKCPFDVLFDC
jgi:hypothetical protein